VSVAGHAERLRRNKWTLVHRLAAWHGRFRARSPRLASVVQRLVRIFAGAYARLELPRGVGLVEAAVAVFPDAWPRSGQRETTGLWHGYRLRLRCADYFQRLTYVLRRYPDAPTQWLIRRALVQGDTVIDGGANIGMISLFSAWCVGPGGRVYALEPNPAALSSLMWHVEANGLRRVTVVPCGLGERDEERELFVPDGDNLGSATFAPPPARYGGSGRGPWQARVVRGDLLPGLIVGGALLIKLDVEGYELSALRGMTGLIERCRPLILTEVNEEMLAQAGAGAADLRAFMDERGYIAFAYWTRRAWVRQRRLVLRRTDSPSLPLDTAWVHPQSVFWERLHPSMRDR
jgi:FkbM family methyltransferase